MMVCAVELDLAWSHPPLSNALLDVYVCGNAPALRHPLAPLRHTICGAS